MKTKGKEIIPARETEVLVSVTCDLCGKVVERPDYSHEGVDWGHGYDEHVTNVSTEKGYSCPSGGSKSGREYHICPECFTKKLEPWLQSQGAKPTETQTDW